MLLETFLVLSGLNFILLTYSVSKGLKIMGLFSGLLFILTGAFLYLDPIYIQDGLEITRTENTSLTDFTDIQETQTYTYTPIPRVQTPLSMFYVAFGLYLVVVNGAGASFVGKALQ